MTLISKPASLLATGGLLLTNLLTSYHTTVIANPVCSTSGYYTNMAMASCTNPSTRMNNPDMMDIQEPPSQVSLTAQCKHVEKNSKGQTINHSSYTVTAQGTVQPNGNITLQASCRNNDKVVSIYAH